MMKIMVRFQYYNDGLLNKMADGSCPATNQQSWKDHSGLWQVQFPRRNYLAS